ncbi:hypothetical protein [Pandoravirus japonicus]|uniref:Uncharacterized protein n=1 Tax=Pandoravirus japonicus TaxID=2823154 RepID=A0A811BME4_9VIRU|nr:hypothetical protein [Pandoravirus japonicus]
MKGAEKTRDFEPDSHWSADSDAATFVCLSQLNFSSFSYCSVFVRRSALRARTQSGSASALSADLFPFFFSSRVQPRTGLGAVVLSVRSSLRPATRIGPATAPPPLATKDSDDKTGNGRPRCRSRVDDTKQRIGRQRTARAHRPAAPTVPCRASAVSRRPHPDGRRRS